MTGPLDVAVHASDDPGPAIEIRRRVFIDEQDVSEAVEFDDKDEEARHFLARVDSEPAGTARVRLLDDQTGRVERVAVLSKYRGQGVGNQIMEAAHDYLRAQERTRAIVHAQARVEAFYESLGYETVDDVEDETGIPHVKMVREL
jgi:predicted GNAT family N-acyltransferase